MSTDPWVLWIAGTIAFVFVAGVMPLAIRAWHALGRSDREISLRKVHAGEIPRVGGFVLLLGFGLVLIGGLSGTHELSASHELFSRSPLTGILIGALICGLTGLWDDLAGLRARYKLLMQVVAAGLAVWFGLHWEALEGILSWLGIDGLAGQALASLATVFYLVAGINAINLNDGLDGLAGGTCAIGLSVVVLSSATHGAHEVAVGWLSACALGAVLGFLLHNRHPARVFMGDTGSYFLGFLLPSLLLSVYPIRERVDIIDLSIPLMVMALPLFDMFLAIVRRYVRGQPIFSGDCDHIHHRMLARGVPHGRVVVILWASSAMFATLAYLNVIGVGGWWTLGGTIVVMLVVAVLLGYHNLLRKLPAFAGEDLLGVRDRRKQVMALLAQIDQVGTSHAGTGRTRWLELAPQLLPVLETLGVPGFSLREAGKTIVRCGVEDAAWAWLSLPLPGSADGEIRLALAVRLPQLQPEQLMLLERIVAALAGTDAAARHSAVTPTNGTEST